DGLGTVTLDLADGHLAGTCGLGHRDGDGEHAVAVVGGDVRGVEVVAEEELAGERSDPALRGEHLVALPTVGLTFDPQREHVALDGEVDVVGRHARQVDGEDHMVAAADRIEGQRGGESPCDLLERAVELAEGIPTKQHRHSSLLSFAVFDTTLIILRKLDSPTLKFGERVGTPDAGRGPTSGPSTRSDLAAGRAADGRSDQLLARRRSRSSSWDFS